jgi:hypothetical protein
MKQLMIPTAMVLVVVLGTYALFAQPADSPQRGSGMGRGGMMGRGMMQGGGADGMGCPGCAAMCGAMMQESIMATDDGGVIVAVAGKLIKYDARLQKVNEANIDVDWTAMHQRMRQMMQNCPMMQQMMKQQQEQGQAQNQ